MSVLIQQARDLATERHAHLHMWNAARSPVIIHIAEVARYVDTHGGTEEMIAAAWLHDIVEDTDITLEYLERQFGSAISSLVDGLTDPPHFAALPLDQRKQMQADRLRSKSNEIKIIKICDQLSNVLRVTNDPPTDWSETTQFQYVQGARTVVDTCRGLNKALDQKFDEAYKTACKRYEGVT
jgi:(p)ppGpp synthase/HD superfamily hydrolase